MSGGGILVLRALGLGDLLTGVPALRALARAVGARHLVLALPQPLAPLARVCVDGLRVLPARGLEEPLCWHRPQVAVNLHGSGPQSHRLLLATRPGRLIAFGHPQVPESREGPRWRRDEHEVDRWCRLLDDHGIAADATDLFLDPERLPRIALPEQTTLIHPGAAAGARRWPAERWAEVARAESAAGRPVVITAGPGEQALATSIREAAGLEASAVHQPDGVLQLAGIVLGAARVLCGDTGVAHLATALRRPSVVLFGPTPPRWWGPPPLPHHVALWKGRVGDPLAAQIDPGLLQITPEEVVAASRGLPAAGSGDGCRSGS